jgi:hypothetical protein
LSLNCLSAAANCCAVGLMLTLSVACVPLEVLLVDAAVELATEVAGVAR